MNSLTVNLLFSTAVFWVAAQLYLVPILPLLGARAVLQPVLLQTLRHLGLMFLAPGAIYAGIPLNFTFPAAFGDVLVALLALATLFALVNYWRAARLLVWISGVEGSVDLLVAMALATATAAAPFMGPACLLDTGLLGAGVAGGAQDDVRAGEALRLRAA